jgi:hypothetical protein
MTVKSLATTAASASRDETVILLHAVMSTASMRDANRVLLQQ